MSANCRIVPSSRVAGASGYSVPRAPFAIDLPLDGNEGLRPPPALLQAAARIEPDTIRRYPSTAPLAEKIALRYGIDPSRVLVTAGGDDALDRVMRAMLPGGWCETPQRNAAELAEPPAWGGDPDGSAGGAGRRVPPRDGKEGREIVFPVPSFEMIERYAKLSGGAVVEVPWPSGPYPRDAVIAAITERTAVICVVSPNNPTGAVATFQDVRAVSEAAPRALVLLDQAYGELGDEDLTTPALALQNVVVVRSLSKAYGLAGLRCGYALGPAGAMGWLRAAGGPYAVAGPSIHLAMERLALSNTDVEAFIARVRFERQALFDLLAEIGYRPVPSQANFVFARCPDPLALRDALAKRGIGIRAFPGKKHLGDAVRITCPGDERDFERLCAALRDGAKEISR